MSYKCHKSQDFATKIYKSCNFTTKNVILLPDKNLLVQDFTTRICDFAKLIMLWQHSKLVVIVDFPRACSPPPSVALRLITSTCCQSTSPNYNYIYNLCRLQPQCQSIVAPMNCVFFCEDFCVFLPTCTPALLLTF